MRGHQRELRESRHLKQEARLNRVTDLEWRNLLAERVHEESLAMEWIDSILTHSVLREAKRRHIELPPEMEDSRHWYRSVEEDWLLTDYGRRQLQRAIRADRRVGLQLALQFAMALTGLLGTVIGLVSLLGP
jgi:hypothetical protein